MVWHTLCSYSFEEQIFTKLKKMKKLICTSVLAILIASMTTVRAQENPEEYLGLPGDNLNLYAVMRLFQESATLEVFERDLNAQDSRINNLDLNGDNLTDYITVTDYVEKDVHTIVLRAVLNRNEYQDVAVFTVQKLKRGKVLIQLIGDEALYGKNYIIEPMYAETPNPGYTGNAVINNYYETSDWPLVIFIYDPFYTGWHSGWYWGFYPEYWNPWHPWYWDYYYGYQYHWYHDYYAHYRPTDHYSYPHYKDYYYDRIRQESSDVAHRISAGSYAGTYSRPDQRKEGEAFYADTHRERDVQGRPASGNAQSQTSAPSRRPVASETEKTDASTSERNSAPVIRSSSDNVSERSSSRPAEASRRSDPESSPRSSAASSDSYSRSEESRPTPAASSRTSEESKPTPAASSGDSEESRPAPAASSRTSEESRPAPAASSRRSEESRPAPAVSSSNSNSEARPSAPSQKSSSEAPDGGRPVRR